MFSGKTALVTGAAGDIGNEMAYQLAQQGATLFLWDVKDNADERVDRIRATGVQVHYHKVDIRDRDAVNSGIDAIYEMTDRLDFVCANAGIGEPMPFLDITAENWQQHIDINLTGSFNVGQAAARRMVKTKTEGRIIFTSSWVGSIPWPDITAYTVSKAGINMLAKQMARELAKHGIRVNVISPGIVRAGMAGRYMDEDADYRARVSKVIPLGEPGTPVELAQAVVYMCSPQTAYMTGTNLVLDGGCSLFQFDSEVNADDAS